MTARPACQRLLLALLGWLALAPAAEAAIESYAIVQDDGVLQVDGRRIRLLGTFLPPSGTVCGTTIRPADCGVQAAVALRQKIQSFVRCAPQLRYPDGSLGAICTIPGGSAGTPPVDLGAWLIEQGFALAAPDAPFSYVALEEIARANGLGVWGGAFGRRY
jgi:endonuclease YncB( thermonuclease family)